MSDKESLKVRLRGITPDWVLQNYYKSKQIRREMTLRMRQLLWKKRSLPDFIIIGVMKSGTTSLFSYLSEHPELIPAYKKEIDYFDGGMNPEIDSYEKGEAWYRAHFPLKKKVKNKKTFEGSTHYLFNPLAAERIYKTKPDIKLIALLRNPVERAISHYYLSLKYDWEPLPMYEAFRQEDSRLQKILKEKDYKNWAFNRLSYKSHGLYKEQLERYYRHFSRDQIMIINSDDFFKYPQRTLTEIFDFLEVDSSFKVQDLKPRNVTSKQQNVDSEVYTHLEDFFKPHNQQLYELLDEDFGWEK